MTTEIQTKTEKYGVARYFLLTAVLSFFGWAFETVWLKIATGKFVERGFLSLPFCPIYGCSLLLVYALVGTPKQGGILLRSVTQRRARFWLYLLFAFIVPSVMELLVGVFFKQAMHIRLWDYSNKALNIGGFVCLRNSIIWSGLIFLFMNYLFSPIQRAVGRLPIRLARPCALVLFALLLADFSLQIALTIY
ncbi:MAG: putative ABC transporter permease [Clostridia bacterium]|nr:putative ABC transporter permease [Clostridia bacterium]